MSCAIPRIAQKQKLCKKPRARSASSSSSASSTDQKEGETKYFERKRFASKDHKSDHAEVNSLYLFLVLSCLAGGLGGKQIV